MGFLWARNRKNPVSKSCTGVHGESGVQLQVLRVPALTEPLTAREIHVTGH